MKILHDTRSSKYREPFGALGCNEPVTLRLETDEDFQGEAEIRLWLEDEEKIFRMKKLRGGFYEFSMVMPETPGHVWYYFILQQGHEVWYLGNNVKNRGGEGVVYATRPPSFQITVHDRFRVPLWFQNRIMYQIFPDSFCNGNPGGQVNNPKKDSFVYATWENLPFYHKDKNGNILSWGFFGGNILGITNRLDHLKSLGVGVLYLNPIFEAASPHRYDTGDYLEIDGVLGTLEDFNRLILEAGKRGIAIILDGVFSHTGADSRYFNKKGTYPEPGAYNSPESPYFPWYTFTNYPEEYQCWWGVTDLPNVREMDKSYREFIYEGENSVIRTWMRRGVKGFRLDVADELPEDFIRGIRKAIEEEDPEGILIGEVWEDATNKVTYGQLRNYLEGDQLHSVMNYPLYQALLDFSLNSISSAEAGDILMSLYENYPLPAILSAMNLIGSHDKSRILTLLDQGNFQLARERLMMLAAFQMALPGVPSIYYGDEAGLEGGPDPDNRRPFPWGREDQEILSWYQRITGLRQSEFSDFLWQRPRVIQDGDFCLILCYSLEDRELWIAMNTHPSHPETLMLKSSLEGKTEGRELFHQLPVRQFSADETDSNPAEEKRFSLEVPALKTAALLVAQSL